MLIDHILRCNFFCSPQSLLKKTVLPLLLFGAFFCSSTTVFAADIKVLVLHSYHQEYPWTKNENAGFVKTLVQEIPDRQIVFATENLDTKRVKFDKDYQEFFFRYLQQKYLGYKPDLIFCTDDNALTFLREYKTHLFGDVPLVFCGVNNLAVEADLDRAQYVGVFEKKEIFPTLDLLKRVDPRLEKILFVGDNSSTHKAVAKSIKSDLAIHFPDLNYEFVESNKLSVLTEKLTTHKKGVVFLTTIGGVFDDKGTVLPLQRTLAALVNAGDFKIVSMEDVYIQQGILGGYVTSGVAQGQAAAGLARDVLQGAPVPSVPLITQSPNVFMFNYPQLQRFKLSVESLPAESIILNETHTLYEEYRYQFWGSLLFVMFQTIIIFLLVTNISKRKGAERALHQANSELEQKVNDRTEALEKAYEDLKDTQSQMLHHEKMASVGQLAAGVAHEINNPIGFISSNLVTLGKYIDRLIEYSESMSQNIKVEAESQHVALRKKLKIDYLVEDSKDLIEESLDGTDRVSKIVQGLKSFSRVDSAEQTTANINECLEGTINIIWNELKYKATVEKEYGELSPTNCYPQQLNQVFMNLLMNAAQAIAESGQIGIRTWQQNNEIFVTVSDTGGGIHPENLNKLFNPFFTTKDVGKGTGLGLSISYDIIKKHNGKLTVESEVGKGSIFTVCIPVI